MGQIKTRFNEDVKTEATAEIQAVLEEQRTNPDFMTSKFLHTFQMSNRSSLAQVPTWHLTYLSNCPMPLPNTYCDHMCVAEIADWFV